jgi:hypothetical protein
MIGYGKLLELVSFLEILKPMADLYGLEHPGEPRKASKALIVAVICILEQRPWTATAIRYKHITLQR